jgi:hypothetical protein
MKKLILLTFFLTACTPNFGATLDTVTKYDTKVPTAEFKEITWTEPTTDEQWAEDTKKESLHLKFDDQLQEMLTSHQSKLEKTLEELYIVEKYPGTIAAELIREGELTEAEIDTEVASQLKYWRWKAEKLTQSVERLKKEIDLRARKVVDVIEHIPAGDERRLSLGNTRSPLGTTYYIDADCATPGDGTTATCNGDADDSFDELDDFTEVARSDGDIAILRRGATATYDNSTDLTFTSDGGFGNTIVIEADFDDAWSDFSSSAQTYTITQGSKTMTASATITGIAANDWICVNTENCRDWAYEVSSVSGTTLTLYLPYKGKASGAGNTLTVMPDAPIWNTAAGDFQWNFDSDNYWKVQGVHVRGTDVNGQIEIDSSGGIIIKDTIFTGDDLGATGVYVTDEGSYVYISKCRSFENDEGLVEFHTNASGIAEVYDCLVDGNDGSSVDGFVVYGGTIIAENIEFVNLSGASSAAISIEVTAFGTPPGEIYLRSAIFDNSEAGRIRNSGTHHQKLHFLLEDFGAVGASLEHYFNDDVASSTTAVLRTGGGSSSKLIRPVSSISSADETDRLKLFEYPIYTDTTSRTYTMYFSSTSTAHWTANPTAVELFLEADYYVNSGDTQRIAATSTATLNFTGSTDWQGISVTAQPAQAGILYLKGWYGKTKEAGADDTNAFYMDVQPVIE